MFRRFALTLGFQFNFLKMLSFFSAFSRYRQIRPSDCHQFWDAHQIICDQVEHEGPGVSAGLNPRFFAAVGLGRT